MKLGFIGWMVFSSFCAASFAQPAVPWPSAKPIRLIVGYPPGGGIDFAARMIQVPLQEALKQQFVVDYKPGASGMLAATELSRAAPDGYTLLLANTGPFAIAPYLRKSRRTTPCGNSPTLGKSAKARTSSPRALIIPPKI
jgi:tripartite-type tricarboxylate transporter receptor subunit TctC